MIPSIFFCFCFAYNDADEPSRLELNFTMTSSGLQFVQAYRDPNVYTFSQSKMNAVSDGLINICTALAPRVRTRKQGYGEPIAYSTSIYDIGIATQVR